MFRLIKKLFTKKKKIALAKESIFSKDLNKIFKNKLDQEFLNNLEELLL